MALLPEDLERIRAIVRAELSQAQKNSGSFVKSFLNLGRGLMIIFLAVLALHVVVIGGFTIYHLMHQE
ncbi:MAG: hypothetical protein LV479_07360 [Methylacidiphilales bacterium]|nr:hypothetical protein [Candidatus Methylacidiphilales bacterium]